MKLYRFPQSAYARKVQMVLDLLGRTYTTVDVRYSDRTELATLTGGYIYVPVLVEDDGQVVCDSRKICQHLVASPGGAALVPAPFDGPVWAYCDWCDGALEDVMFRLSSPFVRAQLKDPGERALYVLVKERKFGPGCVDAWARERESLLERARLMLAPSLRTVEAQPFLFGQHPSLADAALYGLFAALLAVEGELPAPFRPFAPWLARVEAAAPRGLG